MAPKKSKVKSQVKQQKKLTWTVETALKSRARWRRSTYIFAGLFVSVTAIYAYNMAIVTPILLNMPVPEEEIVHFSRAEVQEMLQEAQEQKTPATLPQRQGVDQLQQEFSDDVQNLMREIEVLGQMLRDAESTKKVE